NLAIEEHLVRHADCSKGDLLLLYINTPCMVLGKNQSIYKEINFEYLRNGTLLLCRRISGGGTVYQDEGNLCFSFISQFSEQKINNYRSFNQPVVNALRKIGVDAEMDERNNILCNGKKISGNAQFTNRKNIISHGTILVDANLDVLRASLRPNDFKVESKAVSSVRSSVTNINGIAVGLSSAKDLKEHLKTELRAVDVLGFSDAEWNIINQAAEEKFKSFEWIYGRSPLTTITKSDLQVVVEDGIIREIKTELSLPLLTGIRYEFGSIKKALENYPNASDVLKLLF
ncbi:MAG TPA: lipoate--protein ligase, partial [Chitinophagales bacterium]|nr:lipoate--protein ligase [Chitinophagales bacterium]